MRVKGVTGFNPLVLAECESLDRAAGRQPVMEVRLASVGAPDRAANEDFGFALPALVGVFDAVTAPAGLDTGCVHGPAW